MLRCETQYLDLGPLSDRLFRHCQHPRADRFIEALLLTDLCRNDLDDNGCLASPQDGLRMARARLALLAHGASHGSLLQKSAYGVELLLCGLKLQRVESLWVYAAADV